MAPRRAAPGGFAAGRCAALGSLAAGRSAAALAARPKLAEQVVMAAGSAAAAALATTSRRRRRPPEPHREPEPHRAPHSTWGPRSKPEHSSYCSRDGTRNEHAAAPASGGGSSSERNRNHSHSRRPGRKPPVLGRKPPAHKAPERKQPGPHSTWGLRSMPGRSSYACSTGSPSPATTGVGGSSSGRNRNRSRSRTPGRTAAGAGASRRWGRGASRWGRAAFGGFTATRTAAIGPSAVGDGQDAQREQRHRRQQNTTLHGSYSLLHRPNGKSRQRA